MKDYIDLARRPFLYFWRLATHLVSARGKGQDTVRRDEKTKSVVKSVVPTRTNQTKPIQPTKPNQPVKKRKLPSGPGVFKEQRMD
jgi:hypothetical protein